MENNHKLLAGSRICLRYIGIYVITCYVITCYVIAALVPMLKHRGSERPVNFIRYAEKYVIR